MSGGSGSSDPQASPATATPAAKEPRRSPLVPPNNNLSEDELVVKSFVDLIQHKIDHHILHAPRGEERRVLRDAIVNPGFYYGAAVGLVQFAILRRAPVYAMRRIQRQQGVEANFRESNALKPLSILFDGVLSMMMAGTVWVLTTDKKQLYGAAADIPLLEGRSDISDALCGEFVDMYDGIRPEFWTEYRDDGLTAITQFVNNCRRRQAFERKLRRDASLGPTDPVSIPMGGVPRDYVDDEETEEDWASLEDFEEDEVVIGDDIGGGEGFWTTSGSGRGGGDVGSSWGR